MSFIITPEGGGAVTFDPVVADFDATVGQYWDFVQPDGPFLEIQKIPTPGVDHAAKGRAGFRSQRIIAECYVVGANRSDCMGVLDDLDDCVNKTCSVDIPNGDSFSNAELVAYHVTQQPTDTGYGTFLMKIYIELEEW